MKSFTITGQVLDTHSKKGIANLKVEVWDKDFIFDDFVGSAITDKKGRFQIEFSEKYYRECFLDRQPDLFFKVFRGSTLIKSTEDAVLWNIKKGDVPMTIEVDVPGKEESKGYIVKGQILRADKIPLVNAIVRAFDKDLRSEQLLGETHTDKKGRYEISYTRDQFCRAEKKSADLIVRVFDQEATDLLLAESEIVFNAGPVETINLTVTQIFSEYERYVATISPVRENVPLADLTEDDITFLNKETGIDSERIGFLSTAARLAQQTELPAELFYGLFRQGLPTILSDLLEQDIKILRKALETALDEHIIPSRLRDKLDQYIERLKELAEVDPGIHRKKEQEKIRRLGKVIDLADAKVEAILKKAHSPALINDETLTSLVKARKLKKQEAQDVGLVVSLHTLLDEKDELTEAVKKGNFPQIAQGRVSHIEDLVAFEKADWLNILEEANTEPPDGLNREGYATLLAKKIENLYPSKTLLMRVTTRVADGMVQDLKDLQPLFEHNDRLFASSFDDLNLAGLDKTTVKRLRVSHGRLKGLANTYPGLAIHMLLDDPQQTADTKDTLVRERIGMITRFHTQNPDKEFLYLDYSPESDDIHSLDFTGFNQDQQRMVLKTVKAFQRIYSVTKDADYSKVLLAAGYHSPIHIVNVSPQHLTKETGLDLTVVKKIHKNALDSATTSIIGGQGMLGYMMDIFGKMTVGNLDASSLGEYLKKIDGWEALFGSLDYCQCEHCRSIFSPAAYFVDLMRFVQTHILEQFPRRDDDTLHDLHLKTRRPDLWKLPLTCENTNQLIPYLDIINEVLENYIAVLLGYVPDDLPEIGDDRSPVETLVYEALYNSVNSFQQPFSLPLEKLNIYLSHFDVSRGDVAGLLEVSPDDVAGAAALEISQREYGLITEANSDIGFLRDVYGIEFDNSGDDISFSESDVEGSENDVQLLLKAMELTREELGQLIETQYVCTGSIDPISHTVSIEIRGEKSVSSGEDASVQNDIERIYGLTRIALDRMHRFTRLWRKLSWTINELDLVLSHLSQGIEESTLRHLASILSVHKRFDLSVEETCALWSNIPDISVADDKAPLFSRLFDLPDFVRADGKLLEGPPRNFLHPAFRDTPPDEVDYDLHRLLAGLRLDDEALHLLIIHLETQLGLTLTSEDMGDKEFLLTLENLSLLYRHARLAERLKLSIPQLFQFIHLADAITTDHIGSLDDLSALFDFYDWWQTTDYTLDDLEFITGGEVERPEAYPDASTVTQGILQKVKADQALTFSDTVFAFLEGVTEDQSRNIFADSGNTTIFAKAQGMRYRVAEGTSEVPEIIIPVMPGGEAPIAANPDDLRAVLLTYRTESHPVFDDTLFTAVEGVTDVQSRAIVTANPDLIEPAPLDNTYWLTAAFPGTSISIPEGIPLTDFDAKALLLTYHATEIIPSCIAGELGIPVEKAKGLINITSTDLTESSFVNALQQGDPDGVILSLIEALLPLSVLFKNDALNSDALDFISDHPGLFAELDFESVSIENVRMLSIYHRFLSKTDNDEGRREQFHELLLAFAPATSDSETSTFYTETTDEETRIEIQTTLAQILEAEVGLVITAHEEITLPDRALEALIKLQSCIDLSKRLGVGCEVLKLIVSNENEMLEHAANAIITAFRTKYEDEEEWQEKVEPFEDKIRSRKRDALTDYLIHSLDPKIFSTQNDIYHYFLLDVELEGCARTSRVVAANSSVQLYVHRVLMHLEQDQAGEIQLSMEEDAIEEWEWRKNYRVWEANRKVFLYPENYIEPDLRDNKTPLFEELESTLLQQEINEDTVLDAYASYMRGFDEVANLKIAGSYHDIDYRNETDILHLFGVTLGDPPVYYYRAVENAYHGERDDTTGIIWHPWRKIEVQIPVKKVGPVVFNGRLYVFWVELTTMPKNELKDGSSTFVGYQHKMNLKFTKLRLDRTWTPPEDIPLSLDGWPFETSGGLIEDPLDLDTKIPKYGVREHLEQKDDYKLTGPNWEEVYLDSTHEHFLPNLGISGRNFVINGAINMDLKQIHQYSIRDRSATWNVPLLCAREHNGRPTLYYGFPIYWYLIENAFANLILEEKRIDEFNKEYYTEPIKEGLYIEAIANISYETELAAISGSIQDVILQEKDDVFLIQNSVMDGTEFLLRRIGTTLGDAMVAKLFTKGFNALLDTAHQQTCKEAQIPSSITPMSQIRNATNEGKLDFIGPYGVYYREIFFHIPFLIANHLNSQGKFAEAQKWYHYIFNPTAKETGTEREGHPEDRNWRYIEFRNTTVESLRKQLTDPMSIETYKRDPFNPHAIARLPLRFSAYQKSIVMKYIDNLLDWGDHLFAQDTMESINEATLLYVLASDILGERPAELGECGEVEPKTYEEISSVLNEKNEFLIEVFHSVKKKQASSATKQHVYMLDSSLLYSAKKNAYTVLGSMAPGILAEGAAEDTTTNMSIDWAQPKKNVEGIFRGIGWSLHPKNDFNIKYISSALISLGNLIGRPLFCIPENKNLMGYWDRVEDRLFKIRNCMNISGVRRELSLFAPEIDPMLLVRARAAGLSIEDVLNSISGNLPPYRFSYLIERAKGYAAMLQGFGGALLGSLEKKDIEQLNLDRTVHQQNILRMTRQVRQWEIDAATEARKALGKRKETVEYRRDYYNELIEKSLLPAENVQLVSQLLASSIRGSEALIAFLCASLALIPETGSPFAMVYGGRELSDSGRGYFAAMEALAKVADNVVASSSLVANFKRREESWEHQKTLADHELNEIEKQIKAAEIRLEIANRAIEIHDKSVEQLDEVYEFYQDKFTNLGLYTWLSTTLQRLFREAYNNAYAMAKLAEQAYRFERGDDAAEMIGPNHWEASKAGLLAGERLLLDLQNLERKFLETNYRSLEIDQAFSLTQIDPAALINLKETGTCQFTIPEFFFDLFYPGHYRRKIKAVRLTIPCITGPYTNISATLRLTGSQLRNEPNVEASLLRVPLTRTVAIATSTAQNDAGVFELNFRDERYMPFEGAGAISEWELSLPKNFRQFDYQTINDVILHISYTAEEDMLLRDAVEEEEEGILASLLETTPLVRVFSFRNEFSSEFNRLLHSLTDADSPVSIQIEDKHFPIFVKGRSLSIESAVLILRTPKGQSIRDFEILINERLVPGFHTTDGEWGGLAFAAVDPSLFSSGVPSEHTIFIQNAGDLAPDSLVPPDVSPIDSERLCDIYLCLEYVIS